MKNNTWTWIAVIGLILFGAFLFWGGERIFKPEKPVIKSDTIVKYKLDTIKFAVKEPIYKTFHVHDTASKEVKIYDTTYLFKSDSVQIVKAFFEKRNYQRDIVNDSDLYISLNDTVSQNQLFGGIGRYIIKRPVQNIFNSIVIQPTNKFYIGGGIGSNLRDKVTLSGKVTLQNKKDALYGFKITFIPNEKPIYEISHDIKIKF